jgi:hypothetical protein
MWSSYLMWREKRRGERSLLCSCHPGLVFLNFYLTGLSYKKHSTSQETRRNILRGTEKKKVFPEIINQVKNKIQRMHGR